MILLDNPVRSEWKRQVLTFPCPKPLAPLTNMSTRLRHKKILKGLERHGNWWLLKARSRRKTHHQTHLYKHDTPQGKDPNPNFPLQAPHPKFSLSNPPAQTTNRAPLFTPPVRLARDFTRTTYLQISKMPKTGIFSVWPYPQASQILLPQNKHVTSIRLRCRSHNAGFAGFTEGTLWGVLMWLVSRGGCLPVAELRWLFVQRCRG